MQPPLNEKSSPDHDRRVGPPVPPDDLERRVRRMTRRGFAWGGAAAVAGWAGWRWLVTRSDEGGLPWPLRRVLELDERVARGLSRDFAALARIPPLGGADAPRQRLDRARIGPRPVGVEAPGRRVGRRGCRALVHARRDQGPSPGRDDDRAALHRGLERGRALGRRPAGGPRLGHRAGHPNGRKAGPGDAGGLLDYASLETPDGGYYVGLDMASALHPQTLLCYEMDGRPLTPQHGAPLRLVTPLKYGIKNLKRIGTIRFTDDPARRLLGRTGYDWYAGH